jgi:tRNA A37 methylthiotransferase MiaB
MIDVQVQHSLEAISGYFQVPISTLEPSTDNQQAYIQVADRLPQFCKVLHLSVGKEISQDNPCLHFMIEPLDLSLHLCELVSCTGN